MKNIINLGQCLFTLKENEMKRFLILFLAIATTTMASSQTKIEKLFHEIDSLPEKELLSKSHYEDDTESPSTFCLFSEVKLLKADFEKLEKRIFDSFRDETSYRCYEMLKDSLEKPHSKFRVPYGQKNEYSVQFGSHFDHNYLVTLFRDTTDDTKRHAYAIVWYEKKQAKNDYVIILRYHIYGNEPSSHSIRSIYYDGKQIIDNRGYVVSNGENNEEAIENDLDFMKRFGTLRASFTSTHPKSSLVRVGLVVKIVELCKKHHNLLTDNERVTCDKTLQELITNNSLGDTFIAGMLEEARIAIKKKQ